MFVKPRAAYVVGGVDLDDLAEPGVARRALSTAFVVSLELRPSTVTEVADVVLPVAAAQEKAGSFVDWEGRYRPFAATLPEAGTLSDVRVLSLLADAVGTPIGIADPAAARAELGGLWQTGSFAPKPAAPTAIPAAAPSAGSGQAVLATFHHLLDEGSLQDGEVHLAGTRPAPVVRLSPGTAAEIGAAAGDRVVVSSPRGTITLPLTVTDMPDRVVWVPTASVRSHVLRSLGTAGTVVSIRKGASA
jgi:NADH-quinone oxidoreductase subunit G